MPRENKVKGGKDYFKVRKLKLENQALRAKHEDI